MSGVSVTSASQILESFWNIWSQVLQQKSHFQTFQYVVLACIHYREGYTTYTTGARAEMTRQLVSCTVKKRVLAPVV